MPAPYPQDFRREAVALLRHSGKSLPQLAAELGISPRSLRTWSKRIDVDEGRAEGLSSADRDELRREVRTLTEERAILKKAAAFFASGKRDPVRIFRFIAAKMAEHSIKLMCRVLEVSRSGFHAWAACEPSARAVADARLTGRIAEIHSESHKTYGSPRVHAELRPADGVRVGRKRVKRLMRRAGLSGQIRRQRGKDGNPRAGRAHRLGPWLSAASARPSRTGCGRPISRTSARGKAGCTSRR